jgi:broad specificity phosphatase PhoE
VGLTAYQRAPRLVTGCLTARPYCAKSRHPSGYLNDARRRSQAASFGSRLAPAGRVGRLASPKGRCCQTVGSEGGTPGAVAGWNKPARFRKEQTPEGVRNAERGTNRDLGTPGMWTSEALYAGGDETLRELAATVLRLRRLPPAIL